MHMRYSTSHRTMLRAVTAGLLLGLTTYAHAAELPGKRIDIGTHRLYIDCRGEGSPTVVIDAGMGGFSLEWQHVQSRLAQRVRVCSYDRAGYGYSDSGPAPRTSARMAHELHLLLEKAGVAGPYLLVGHSFGGYNMRYFAHAYPVDTAGLVLIDASHPEQFERFPRRQLPPAAGDSNGTLVTRPVMTDNYPEALRRRAMVLMATYKARHAQGEEFRHFMESAAQVRDLELPDVPILVLSRGRQVWPDTAYGNEMERIWAELQADLGTLSDRTLHLIAANSGHAIHFDQPQAVTTAVLLTATAAHSRWSSWPSVSNHDSGLMAPMLAQSLQVAKR